MKEKIDYAVIMESAKEYVVKEKPLLTTPVMVADFLRPLVQGEAQESFYVFFLNTRNRLMDFLKISTGSVDSCPVHPRDVFRKAIITNTTRIVVAHNHPAGEPTPSSQDCEVTRNLVAAGKIVGIEIIDHVILGLKTATNPLDYMSFKENNLI